MSAVDNAIPLWWHSMFQNGAHLGAFISFDSHKETFIQRDDDCLLVSISVQRDDPQYAETLDQVEHLCIHNSWTHLAYHLTADYAKKPNMLALMKDRLSDPHLQQYARVVFLGIGAGATIALDIKGRFKDIPRVIVIDGSNAAMTIPKGPQVTTFLDPFATKLTMTKAQRAKVITIPAPFLGANIFGTLYRGGILNETVGAAIAGTATPKQLHRAMRARKDTPEYQTAIMQHLRRKDSKPKQTAMPKEAGNVWMLEDGPKGLRYMSDRWNGRVIGYQERNGITLAQTAATFSCVLSIGDHTGIPRPIPAEQNYPWHVVDETLNGAGSMRGARALGTIAAIEHDKTHRALPGVIAIDIPQAGSTQNDADANALLRAKIKKKLSQATLAAFRQGKTVNVERVSLGLFAGATQLGADDAVKHYINFIRWLQAMVVEMTGQAIPPVFSLSQASGGRSAPNSEVILAEGRLETELPTTDLVVASPIYPYSLMENMPNTTDPTERLILDELEYHAVTAVQRDEKWYCPTLRLAEVKGNKIHAQFTTLSPLVLEPSPHGYNLVNCDGVEIHSAEVIDKNTVLLHCNAPVPTGSNAQLCYAWGSNNADPNSQLLNTGKLRDSWTSASNFAQDITLKRYALAGAVGLLPG